MSTLRKLRFAKKKPNGTRSKKYSAGYSASGKSNTTRQRNQAGDFIYKSI
jgi:hypothetical protein